MALERWFLVGECVLTFDRFQQLFGAHLEVVFALSQSIIVQVECACLGPPWVKVITDNLAKANKVNGQVGDYGEQHRVKEDGEQFGVRQWVLVVGTATEVKF